MLRLVIAAFCLASSGFAETYLLTEASEHGEPLLITGQVLDAESRAGIPDAEIYLYQADTNGEYSPADSQDESTARISGLVISNEEGTFAFQTILPGEYPDQAEGNRHIHIHYARAGGYKEIGKVILFEHNVRNEVREWANTTGFGIIIELIQTDDGYVGELELVLESK